MTFDIKTSEQVRQVKKKMNRLLSSGSYCGAVLFSLLLPAMAQAIDAEYFGNLLLEAQQQKALLPDIYRINPNLDEQSLYDIQKAYVAARLNAGDVIGGFKGGFIPKAPVGGVLFGGEKILRGSPTIRLEDFSLLVVEAEIGFKFCAPITTLVPDIATLKKHVCEIIPVMEIADGAIADFGEVKKDFKHLRNTLISINVASSHTLLGEPRNPRIDLSSISVAMNHNGEQIGLRDMNAKFDFWQNVLWVVNHHVVARGYQLEPGQFIIGGNLTGIHVATKGEYVADFGPLGNLSLLVE